MAEQQPPQGVRIEVGDDWAAGVADTIVSTVDSIRQKTAVPLTSAAYGVVYGLLAGLLAMLALVLLAIAAVRGLAIAYDNLFDAGVWAAHATVGGIFLLAGLFVWSKRRPKSATS